MTNGKKTANNLQN